MVRIHAMFQINKTLLQVLRTKEGYKKLSGSVKPSLFDKEIRAILLQITKYWDTYISEHDEINIEIFAQGFRLHNQHLTDDEWEVYQDIFLIMQETPDETIAFELIKELKTMQFSKEVDDATAEYATGEEIDLFERLRELVNEYERDIRRVASSGWCKASLEDIVTDELKGQVLVPRLHCLQNSMPSLRTGMQIIVAARPGKGKTSFCADLITGFMLNESYRKSGRPILWFNNEGKAIRIKGNCVRSALRKDFNAIMQMGWANASDQFELLTGGNDRLRIYDIHGRDYKFIERIIEEAEPICVIFDMLDNIKGFRAGGTNRTDERLEKLYQWSRESAVIYDFLSIATSQVSAEGADMQWVPETFLKDSRCLGRDTPVRMFSGSVKKVQQVQVGDYVMGTDSKPRKVLYTGSGTECMYRVGTKNWDFVCNESHILTVIKSTKKQMNGHTQGQVLDIPLKYFLDNPSRLSHYKALKACIEYPEAELPMEPYVFGLWLGDGSLKEVKITTADAEIREYLEGHINYQHTYNQKVPLGCKPLVDVYHIGGRDLLRKVGTYKDKYVPIMYKLSSTAQRKQLLAGIMDSDGWVDHGSSVVTLGNKRLAQDIREVADSLGYRTSFKEKTTNFGTQAYSVVIANTEMLPVLLDRKRTVCKQQYDKMTITNIGVDNYYGFTVDGDSRYVLGNYIVTHNTGKQGACDAIITIGTSPKAGFENSRFIYVPKSKFEPKEGFHSDCRTEVYFNGKTSSFHEGIK